MKKLILSLAVMALFSAGCQKPELESPFGNDLSFVASVEAFSSQTKTAMNSDRQVLWTADDRVAIFQGSTIADEYAIDESCAGKVNAVFNLVEDNSSVNGSFSAGSELPCNIAFYPYSAGLSLMGAAMEDGRSYEIEGYSLPSVQHYVANSFGNGAFPMVAVTKTMTNHELQFKNVLGAMKLQLKGTQSVKSIKVEGNNGEKLSGAATVTAYDNNLIPAITMTGTDETSKSVTLDCGDGVQLNTTSDIDFIIALPPVLFEKGFTVTVTDSNAESYNISTDVVNTVLRSSILVMPEFDLNGINYIDEYGINHGAGIRINETVWAPVNCGYHEIDYKWGKLYQWGRKYGQGYVGEMYNLNGDEIGVTSDSTSPEWVDAPVSILEGNDIANSNNFYFTYDYDNWLYPHDNALWNAGTEDAPIKTEYDPCPQGWRVPTYAELNELTMNSSSLTTNHSGQQGIWFSGKNTYTEEVPQVFFPAAGSLGYVGGYGRGWGCCYWSSRAQGVTSAFHSNGYSDRKDGYSVRCVHNSSVGSFEPVLPVSLIEMNLTSLILNHGDVGYLFATVHPCDAADKTLVWSSSNPNVASVNQSGLVVAVSAGNAIITVAAGGKSAFCDVTVVSTYIDELTYIDEYGINHGAGIRINETVWAPVNCGYHEIDYKWGKLYQWGRKYGQGYGDSQYDVNPDFDIGPVSIVEGNHITNSNVVYVPYSIQGIQNSGDWLYPHDNALWNAGTEDAPIKTEYDPCPQGWRVPTYAELNELTMNSSSLTTNHSGQQGIWFSGKNTYTEEVPQVFFPAAGKNDEQGSSTLRGIYAMYWSSRPNDGYNHSTYCLYRDCRYNDYASYMRSNYRAAGFSVRCVLALSSVTIPVSYINLNANSLDIYEGCNSQLIATVGPDEATEKTVSWTSDNPKIATIDHSGLVTAVSVGSTTIRATAGEKFALCSVNIIQVKDYIDENGVNHGKGVKIGKTVWAPVNCGYDVLDYKWGKLYQWGRKYGQGYSGELSDGDWNVIGYVADVAVPELLEGGTSLQGGQSENNRNVFFVCSDTPYDWLYPQDGTLWNSGTEESPKKTEYDPCPEGWRVPTYTELSQLQKNRSSWTTDKKCQEGYWFSGQSSYTNEVDQVFFPAAGSRNYYDGIAYARGGSGFFWSSKSYYDNSAYSLNFSKLNAYVKDYHRANGFSVRCVQE